MRGSASSKSYAFAAIAVCGVLAVAAAYVVYDSVRPPTIDDFAREYEQSDSTGREAVADTYLTMFSAQEMLDAIEEQNAGRLCHVQGHAIGRSIYKQSGDFAASVQLCGNACTYGCFHGAMMAMFKTESDTLGGAVDDETPEQVVAHVKEIAPDLCSKPEVASAVPYLFCVHGVGHVFAFIAQTDLEKAISDCNVMPAAGIRACVTGVFMEHMFDPKFVADTETKTEAPCDRFPKYTEPCLRYKSYGWIRAWGGIAPALKACDVMGADALTCIRTVGEASSSAELRRTKEGFHAICGSLSDEKFKACVAGVILKAADVNDGEDTASLCGAMAPEYQSACVRVIDNYLSTEPKRS